MVGWLAQLGAPNSSYLWVRYMAFQLGLTEIEKARALGERALKTIELGEVRRPLGPHGTLELDPTVDPSSAARETRKRCTH